MSDGTATAYVWYIWDCPVCGETQEADPADVDPTGSDQECRDCGRTITIEGSAI
ncbi:hypothetical protein SEA_GRASSBOY_4 [Microbacterium phage Grassboy]|nr:hypothetical protein SEA_GRASSBOY_4 [Microbacterium phage Grassboy]